MTTEEQKAEEKYRRQHARAVRDFGYGDTRVGLALTREFVPELSRAIAAKLALPRAKGKSGVNSARDFIALLGADVSAVCTLQTLIHSVAEEERRTETLITLGRAIRQELWAEELRKFSPELTAKIEREVRTKHGSLAYRRQAARSLAKRAGFKWRVNWTSEEAHVVGAWLLDCALAALPDVFEMQGVDEEHAYISLTPDGLKLAEHACAECIKNNPVFLPHTEPPQPWSTFKLQGPYGLELSMVRTHHKSTETAVREAIASGQMAPTLAALNSIQGTGWRVNETIYYTLMECYERGVELPKFPRKAEYPEPPKPRDWKEMVELERTQWKARASAVRKANRIRNAHNLSFFEDMQIAETLLGKAFYTPCNIDWRGRVYPFSHFNFQREDRVRGLFLFEEGRELGEHGLKWLKIHLANCGDFNKISKRSFEEREQWTNENLASILVWAEQPLSTLTWTKADKPFLFLAACIELSQALKSSDSSRFVSHLPVSWDGSCSGLQHLCAMTRSPEGAFVNLTPSPQPQDVYQRVADLVSLRIDADAEAGQPIAEKTKAYGVDRSLVKRNVMTYSYSSGRSGMADQLDEDVMKPLKLKEDVGDIEEHPFGVFAEKYNEDAPSAASRYLAKHNFECIEQVVKKPAEAMHYLKTVARAMAHENKPVVWITPTGLPWINRYHKAVIKKVRLWLHDQGVQIKSDVAVGYSKEIARTKAANGVAPNFVHALDAAHLMLTVNAAVSEAITSFALVHDSFGCHAGVSERFHQIIREQFVQMYEEHDVLNEVYERAKHAVSHHNWRRLPKAIEYGDLNIQEVINAKYAFA